MPGLMRAGKGGNRQGEKAKKRKNRCPKLRRDKH